MTYVQVFFPVTSSGICHHGVAGTLPHHEKKSLTKDIATLNRDKNLENIAPKNKGELSKNSGEFLYDAGSNGSTIHVTNVYYVQCYSVNQNKLH
jgi:hypothetical protein